jgi:hypothetical protein
MFTGKYYPGAGQEQKKSGVNPGTTEKKEHIVCSVICANNYIKAEDLPPYGFIAIIQIILCLSTICLVSAVLSA